MDTHKKMTGSEAVVESINILPEISNYASLVEYVNSQGYGYDFKNGRFVI